MQKYGKSAAFLGLREEYESFVKAFGMLPLIPTDNMLDVARAIAGCKLFVGNQTGNTAIAEAIKVPTITEVWPLDAYPRIDRPDAILGFGPDVVLPEVI